MVKQNYRVHKEIPTGVKSSYPEYGGIVEVFYRVKEPFNNPINAKENK